MEAILIDEYNYPLPDERIAKYPLAQRDHSKLLVYRDGRVSEDHFYNIGNFIPEHSLLIYNNTRVIQARLVFHKESGARVEVFCLEPIAPRDYALSLGSTSSCTWKCMIGNLKKWKTGKLELYLHRTPDTAGTAGHQTPDTKHRTLKLTAERLSTTGNTHEVRFEWHELSPFGGDREGALSFAEILDQLGELPIPPYLNRATEESDKTTYQTVYSRIKGSVAAPTAGLHFTDEVLNDLRARGIQTTELTLHVGAGTFQPVKTADANEHTMHTEIIAVPRKAIEDIRAHLGHIVAVGTTSMRTLESLYFFKPILEPLLADKDSSEHILHVGQFTPYQPGANDYTVQEALDTILRYLDMTNQDTLHAETQIMIRPGYEFHVVDQLITNFHQPKSTLLLLVSAFVKGDWHTIYDYALSHNFRFLSYGDSSILYKR